jgi:hypothetical protein
MKYPELEINLVRRDTASYAVQLRFRAPDEEAEQRAEAYPVRFDFNRLQDAVLDAAAYGRLLGEALFADPEVRSLLRASVLAMRDGKLPLRLRLCFDRWSFKLHALRWETLRDPETGRSLLTDESILFSRHLGSGDMRPVRLRSRTAMRALVVVANPTDLAQYRPDGRALPPLDVAMELQRARAGLEGIAVTELAGEPRVTLAALLDKLREDYDILYLVCHGALIDREPRLWLEDETGRTKVTAGIDLVDGLARLVRLPRLMILASCQSAGTGDDCHSDDDGVLAALGPRLAEAGVPAIIAMQGNVLQRTVAGFVPTFFRELHKDGQIDRAMTEARFAVRDQPDSWAPVLYTRLVNGRLWNDQQFGGQRGFDAWPGLINQIRRGKCVPILGSGLLEPYLGSSRDLARRWAATFRYPLSPALLCDLPQVAQYLSITQGTDYPRDEFVRDVIDEVLRRWPSLRETPGEVAEEPVQRFLRLLSAARAAAGRQDPSEPHQVLARLSCPVYLTTNPDNLLVDALRAAGREPREELCPWQFDRAAEEPASPAPYTPTVAAPLVYQMFGRVRDIDSLVLTEDDYFNYLIGITRLQNRPQPSKVLEVLANSGLMFLGFRIDDWDFRVFVHFLNSQPNVSLRRRYKHVAVQLDPEEGLGADPVQARRYLEKYFGSPHMQIEIYWGSVEDFLQELNARWKEHA